MKKYQICVVGPVTEDDYVKDLIGTRFYFTGTLEEGLAFYKKVTPLMYRDKVRKAEFTEVDTGETKQ